MPVAGIVLTGGASTRMGHDKATLRLRWSTETLAQRTARLLGDVAEPCLEVGPGHTGLAFVREDPQGSGPLAALAAGWLALADAGWGGPVLVVATDLPALNRATLRWLATRPGTGSVVPQVNGRPQPLCARWAPQHLEQAVALAARGRRALRDLLEACRPALVDPAGPGGPGHTPFCDVDTPRVALAMRVSVPLSSPGGHT